jgi:hypothetical protein
MRRGKDIFNSNPSKQIMYTNRQGIVTDWEQLLFDGTGVGTSLGPMVPE